MPPPLRVKWVDSAKGIAILLTIIGHTVSYNIYGSSLRGLIFSFHMPLFFILSCYTYNPSSSLKQLEQKVSRAFQHLIVPATLIYVLRTLLDCFKSHPNVLQLHYWKDFVYTFLFASGVGLTFNNFDVAAIGIPWFFFALFLGRSLFDYFHLAFSPMQLPVIVILVGFSGIFFGRLQWLPFSLDIALAAMPFFYFGFCMRKIDLGVRTFVQMFFWGMVWIGTLFLAFPHYEHWTYLELATRRYNLFPISYLTAIAGTLFVCAFCVLAEKYCAILIRPISYLGRNSMYVLCVHILDSQWADFWKIPNHQFHSSLRRVIIDCLISIIFVFIVDGYKHIKKSMKTSSRT